MIDSIKPILFAGLVALASLAAADERQIEVQALFENQAMVSIDGKRRLLKQGMTSPEGVTLIRSNSRGAVLDIDGQRREYQLGRRIGSKFRSAKGGSVLRIWPSTSGMYTTTGSINGYPITFLVDTGATLVAMNRNEAKRLGIDYLVEGKRGRSSTASGVVDSYRVRLKRVKVGTIELRDVLASVIDSDHPDIVLLGNSFLNRLNLERNGEALVLKEKNF
ncbi:MAG: TIGR02281 family clan AA aspartic protease [Pseudomonadota bacterium]